LLASIIATATTLRCIGRLCLDLNQWGAWSKWMPLAQYFAWVGSALLALLFLADAYLPKLPAAEKPDVLPPAIHVHSVQKWPERVVYDTSAPVPKSVPAANPENGPSPPKIAVASPKLREALAELQTIDAKSAANPKQPETRLQRKRNLAKKRAPKPVLFAARRSPFGWFGPTIW
jgi:hypothetical protein